METIPQHWPVKASHQNLSIRIKPIADGFVRLIARLLKITKEWPSPGRLAEQALPAQHAGPAGTQKTSQKRSQERRRRRFRRSSQKIFQKMLLQKALAHPSPAERRTSWGQTQWRAATRPAASGHRNVRYSPRAARLGPTPPPPSRPPDGARVTVNGASPSDRIRSVAANALGA